MLAKCDLIFANYDFSSSIGFSHIHNIYRVDTASTGIWWNSHGRDLYNAIISTIT